jgi:hypothetical protein
MKKLIILIGMLLSISLYAESFNQNGLLGIWEISSVKDSGLVEFGADRPKHRGEVWTLKFSRDRIVDNQSTGSKYEYYVNEDGMLVLFKRKYRDHKRYSKITKKSRMYIIGKDTGMYNGCYLVKIERNMFTQYKSNRTLRMCKMENESIPTYNVNSQNIPDIFH